MGDSNTQRALRIVLQPFVDLQAAMFAVITQRSVDNARGVQLTTIGKIVGRTGRVLDDEIERRYVRAQISVNKSDGLVEDILTVARLVVDDPAATIALDNTGTAAYVLRIEGVAVPDDAAAVLVQLVLKATSAGVRAVVVWEMDPSTTGRWGIGTWGTSTWGRSRDEEF